MDENDVKIGTACMNKIQEVLKEFGCGMEIVFSFSSISGPSWLLKVSPLKNIVIPDGTTWTPGKYGQG